MEFIFGDSGWLRIVPAVYTTGQAIEIESLGTKSDFLAAIKATPSFAGATSADTKAKWFTSDIANGNQLSIPDTSKNYNVIDDSEISDDSTSTNTASFACSVTCTAAQRSLLMGWFEDGTAVIGSREIGKSTPAKGVAGYEFILGKIADLKEVAKTGPNQYDFSILGVATFTIKAGTGPDIADYNTIATGAGNTITAVNESARTILALTSDDFTRLFTGKLVTKLTS